MNAPSGLAKSILSFSYSLPLLRMLSSRSPIVLLYHGVPRRDDDSCITEAVFEQHILLLKRYCDFATPQSLGARRNPLDKVRVLLTFDDGMRNNAVVVAPILRQHKVPAVFFVCSRHATPGKYLWFVYLDALERHFAGNGFRFRGEFVDMTTAQRQTSVKRLSEFLLTLTPHPGAMYQVIEEELPRLEDFVSEQVISDCYAGMTAEQVGELADDPLFSIGIHTVDHPFLTRCDGTEMMRQIHQNKTWIEDVCRRPCNAVAYPGGDYNSDVIASNRNLGIAHGFAVMSKMAGSSPHEIPRVGVYATSLEILGFKAYWGNYIRRFNLNLG